MTERRSGGLLKCDGDFQDPVVVYEDFGVITALVGAIKVVDLQFALFFPVTDRGETYSAENVETCLKALTMRSLQEFAVMFCKEEIEQ